MPIQENVAPGAENLPPDEIYFGQTMAMHTVRRCIEKAAGADVPLLIEGCNGTGKEVLARLVHARSSWSKGSFVKVNCAAIPGPLMESELFGYERGAFTGANSAKSGRVEMADGGTLFLDDIGELDPSVQATLLQFLQDGHYSRIGDQEERQVHTRVICATSRQLEQEVAAGAFRVDLFYRINVIHVKLPLLRDRVMDIPALASYFLAISSTRFQQAAPTLSPEILHLLRRRDWPGNIRELENCMARCVILGIEEALEGYLGEFPQGSAEHRTGEDGVVPFKRLAAMAGRELERDVILKTLESHNWNRRKTAQTLKISYRTLLYKLRDAGLPSTRQRRVEYPVNTAAGGAGSTD